MEETMDQLAGKVAFVTAAGGGIAAAVARRFAAEGAAVCCVDIDDDKLARTARAIADDGGRGLARHCDVTEETAVIEALQACVDAFGRLDIVLNAAAAAEPEATVETMPLATWNEVIEVNLTGMFVVCKYAIPHMRAAGGGAIINIASTFGHIAWPRRPAYMASKGAVRQLTRSIALDFAGDGIRANSISPGAIETDRLLQRTPTMEQVRARMVPLHPIGRLGQPEEIADAALFLASPQSSFATGADFLIDGGFTAV
jgi:NAD(P)-dependent dehydrogenase (short-subunit alcohol dehydrogenase family)